MLSCVCVQCEHKHLVASELYKKPNAVNPTLLVEQISLSLTLVQKC